MELDCRVGCASSQWRGGCGVGAG